MNVADLPLVSMVCGEQGYFLQQGIRQPGRCRPCRGAAKKRRELAQAEAYLDGFADTRKR